MKKQWKRALQASLVSIACLLLAGCVVFAEFFFGIAPAKDLSSRVGVSLPELSGPYPVGRRYFDWVDRSRRDPFDRSADRELVVSLWYPARVSGTPEAGTYLPGEWGRLAGRYQSMLLRIRGQSFLSALVRDPLPTELIAGISTHAAEGAVISGDRPSFPVLLFSPGFGAMPTEYTALLEDVASHGYIVAGINPTDFVPITVFEDGRIAHAPLWDFSLYDPEKDYPVWVRDMLFVLTQLFEQNRDPKSPLFSHLDMTSVGAFGHSFGGAASAGAILTRGSVRG
jgi:predicted dienelactone hydrolase